MAIPPDDRPTDRAAVLAQDIRALAGKLKRRLREQGNVGDLTPSQTAVLLGLEKSGPATTSELARAEAMRPQSMGTVIAALESAGLVQGTPDPDDGRKTIVSLTDSCRQWISEGRAARQDWLLRMIQSRLSPQEQEELATAIPLLQRLVED
ncbi:MAG: MarR family transcriptional regulator [Pseudomonadota bacterium]|uniref:MarR family winged helix-turn-helix transcriptional regulator n=1 Tax=Sphingomonas sp. ERG5 TaxID=1381597 RepID=UPI00054BA937|nr:MarR family transcriptional regulator [Sphingomonas sp. ERG5]